VPVDEVVIGELLVVCDVLQVVEDLLARGRDYGRHGDRAHGAASLDGGSGARARSRRARHGAAVGTARRRGRRGARRTGARALRSAAYGRSPHTARARPPARRRRGAAGDARVAQRVSRARPSTRVSSSRRRLLPPHDRLQRIARGYLMQRRVRRGRRAATPKAGPSAPAPLTFTENAGLSSLPTWTTCYDRHELS